MERFFLVIVLTLAGFFMAAHYHLWPEFFMWFFFAFAQNVANFGKKVQP